MELQAPPPESPAWVTDLLHQADALRRAGRYPLSLALYRRVVAAAPGHAVAQQHLGALLTLLGRAEEAEPIIRAQLARAPGDPLLRHTLAQVLMSQGRYPEAWSFYEARHELPALGLPKPEFPFPEWRGEDLAGKRLAVFPEQGLGDQIQFTRFLPGLQATGAEVVLMAPPPLARIFAHSYPTLQVVEAAGPVEFPDPDYWTQTGALIGRLGVTIDRAWTGPYLRAPGALAAGAVGEGFKVGLMTRGNPHHRHDALRSLSAENAAWLANALPGRITSLAPADTGARDFADTAALIEALDLVVSVDTSVVHLAGALGKPAFVLVPGVGADWRWLRDRDDSPWYPSLRLFRGDERGGWEAAMARLVEDARTLAAQA
jgi:tetratricopeptide (TPR) repeat protein